MNEDELRRRLRAADPAATSTPTDSWIPELVEATMNTPDEPTKKRAWAPLVAAAALAAAVAGGFAVLNDSDDADNVAAKPTSLSLALPGGDPAMSMCMMFDVDELAKAPMAFSGTVASVDDGTVTLDVDHWYVGGDADQVVLTNEGAAANVALDGVDFAAGNRYLVSASNGTVSTCGYSGPWSAEFEAQFDQAFGS